MSVGAWPLLAVQFGDSVTYKRDDFEDVDLTACVGPVEAVEQPTSDGIGVEYARDVVILTDESATDGGIAEPKRGHEVEIDGDTWVVDLVTQQGGSMAQLRCVRPVMVERSRPMYRGRQ